MNCEQIPSHIGGQFYSKNPINDFHLGVDTSKYEEGEKELRCKLASLYRLTALLGWNDNIFNHISARVSPGHDHFLINPFGLLYDEITASSLVKIDQDGNVIDQGSTNFSINRAGFVLHSAVHMGRKDAVCVVHLHTAKATGIACTTTGYLPLSQDSLIPGQPKYHDYQGIAIDENEKKSVIEDLDQGKFLVLRNHGFMTIGKSVEEAFSLTYWFLSACDIQVNAMASGEKSLNLLTPAILRKIQKVVEDDTTSMDSNQSVVDLTFTAFVRKLDRMGLNPGFEYENRMPFKYLSNANEANHITSGK